jgi:hypothetical protein
MTTEQLLKLAADLGVPAPAAPSIDSVASQFGEAKPLPSPSPIKWTNRKGQPNLADWLPNSVYEAIGQQPDGSFPAGHAAAAGKKNYNWLLQQQPLNNVMGFRGWLHGVKPRTALVDAAKAKGFDPTQYRALRSGGRLLQQRLGDRPLGGVSVIPGSESWANTPAKKIKMTSGTGNTVADGVNTGPSSILNHELAHLGQGKPNPVRGPEATYPDYDLRALPAIMPPKPTSTDNDYAAKSKAWEQKRLELHEHYLADQRAIRKQQNATDIPGVQEIGPSLGDLVFNAEHVRRTIPDDIGHDITFPSGKTHDANWMADQARRHGYFGENGKPGKSMAALLATPAGRSWLQQAMGTQTSNSPNALDKLKTMYPGGTGGSAKPTWMTHEVNAQKFSVPQSWPNIAQQLPGEFDPSYGEPTYRPVQSPAQAPPKPAAAPPTSMETMMTPGPQKAVSLLKAADGLLTDAIGADELHTEVAPAPPAAPEGQSPLKKQFWNPNRATDGTDQPAPKPAAPTPAPVPKPAAPTPEPTWESEYYFQPNPRKPGGLPPLKEQWVQHAPQHMVDRAYPPPKLWPAPPAMTLEGGKTGTSPGTLPIKRLEHQILTPAVPWSPSGGEPVRRFKVKGGVTPYNHLERYYRHVGGIDKAVEGAEQSMQKNTAKPPMPNWRRNWTQWNTSNIKKPTDVYYSEYVDAGKPSPYHGALAQPRKNAIPSEQPAVMMASPAVRDGLRPTMKSPWDRNQSALEHEVSHDLFGLPEARTSNKTWADNLRTPSMRKDEGYRYKSQPSEVDVQLAEVKRRYAAVQKRLVNSPEEAKRALEWWKRRGPIIDKQTEGGKEDSSYGDRFRNILMDMDEEGLKNFYHRMPELVQNNQSQQKTAAALLKAAEGLLPDAIGADELYTKVTPTPAPAVSVASQFGEAKPLPKPKPKTALIDTGMSARAPALPPYISDKKPIPPTTSTLDKGFTSAPPMRDHAALTGVSKERWLAMNAMIRDLGPVHDALDAGSISPKSRLKRWYENTPGGFDGALADAVRATNARPPTGAINNFAGINPGMVNDPVPVELKNSQGDDSGSYNARHGIILRERADLSGPLRPNADRTLDHELTHHLTTTPGIFEPSDESVSKYAPKIDPKATKDRWADDPDYFRYSTTPTELDPRIAEIKRQYTYVTGRRVNTPEVAEDAINWWKTHGVRFKGQHNDSTNDAMIKDPRTRQLYIQRMLELVGNQSNDAGKYASELAQNNQSQQKIASLLKAAAMLKTSVELPGTVAPAGTPVPGAGRVSTIPVTTRPSGKRQFGNFGYARASDDGGVIVPGYVPSSGPHYGPGVAQIEQHGVGARYEYKLGNPHTNARWLYGVTPRSRNLGNTMRPLGEALQGIGNPHTLISSACNMDGGGCPTAFANAIADDRAAAGKRGPVNLNKVIATPAGGTSLGQADLVKNRQAGRPGNYFDVRAHQDPDNLSSTGLRRRVHQFFTGNEHIRPGSPDYKPQHEYTLNEGGNVFRPKDWTDTGTYYGAREESVPYVGIVGEIPEMLRERRLGRNYMDKVDKINTNPDTMYSTKFRQNMARPMGTPIAMLRAGRDIRSAADVTTTGWMRGLRRGVWKGLEGVGVPHEWNPSYHPPQMDSTPQPSPHHTAPTPAPAAPPTAPTPVPSARLGFPHGQSVE